MNKPIGLIHQAKYRYAEMYEERAGIMEFDAGMTREDAERSAFVEVYKEFQAEYPAATNGMFRQAIEYAGRERNVVKVGEGVGKW